MLQLLPGTAEVIRCRELIHHVVVITVGFSFGKRATVPGNGADVAAVKTRRGKVRYRGIVGKLLSEHILRIRPDDSTVDGLLR